MTPSQTPPPARAEPNATPRSDRGRPRLLIVVDDSNHGGTFKVAERLAAGLADRFSIHFSCFFAEFNASTRRDLTARGVAIIRHHVDSAQLSRATHDTAAAATLLAATAPDAVLFVDSSVWSNIAAKRVAGERGVPYASITNFVENGPPELLRRYDAPAARAAAGAQAMVFVSDANRALHAARFPDAARRARVIPNAVPDAFFRDTDPVVRETLRRDLGLGPEDTMLLLIGRVEPRKGQILALKALDRLRREIDTSRIHLVLVGFGLDDEVAALTRDVAALGLEANVRRLGIRDDIPDLLDACDIVVFPSYREGDPLVTKEAMAKARAVIASDLAEIREQGHPEALLVPAPANAPERTVEGLAAAIEDLCLHPARREGFGRDLKRIAESRFREHVMIDAYTDLIRELLAVRGDRPPTAPVAVPGIVVGRRLNLADPEQAWTVLRDGWAELEADGVWSLGDVSTLLVRMDAPTRAARITIGFKGLVGPDHGQSTDVFVNGEKVADWQVSKAGRTRRTIDVAFRIPKRRIVVRLKHHGAITPRELGLGDDRRKLGLFVSSLKIDVPGATGIVDRLRGLFQWR